MARVLIPIGLDGLWKVGEVEVISRLSSVLVKGRGQDEYVFHCSLRVIGYLLAVWLEPNFP